MTVKKDDSGRRSVQSEVEVPGTPEEVWRAIATGPGISAWFCPTEVEERAGGQLVCHMGPGMDAVATVTDWNPPHSLAAEGDWGGGAPPVATEWTVEARAGGTCIVRVVHSLFASTDDWDGQLEGTETGWPKFFRVLRLYLEHFEGQRCAGFTAMGNAARPVSDVWAVLGRDLGFAGVSIGGACRADSAGAPSFAGTLASHDAGEHAHALVRLDEPGPGIASLQAFPMGDRVYVGVNVFLYGDTAPPAAEREGPAWQSWVTERFPPPASCPPPAS